MNHQFDLNSSIIAVIVIVLLVIYIVFKYKQIQSIKKKNEIEEISLFPLGMAFDFPEFYNRITSYRFQRSFERHVDDGFESLESMLSTWITINQNNLGKVRWNKVELFVNQDIRRSGVDLDKDFSYTGRFNLFYLLTMGFWVYDEDVKGALGQHKELISTLNRVMSMKYIKLSMSDRSRRLILAGLVKFYIRTEDSYLESTVNGLDFILNSGLTSLSEKDKEIYHSLLNDEEMLAILDLSLDKLNLSNRYQGRTSKAFSLIFVILLSDWSWQTKDPIVIAASKLYDNLIKGK